MTKNASVPGIGNRGVFGRKAHAAGREMANYQREPRSVKAIRMQSMPKAIRRKATR